MNIGILCPHCKSSKWAVHDTRKDGEAIVRRCRCKTCSKHFSTYEGLGAPGGRLARALHLQQALHELTPARRVLIENLIVELGGDGK